MGTNEFRLCIACLMAEAHFECAGHRRGQRGFCPLVSEYTDQRWTESCCTVIYAVCKRLTYNKPQVQLIRQECSIDTVYILNPVHGQQ